MNVHGMASVVRTDVTIVSGSPSIAILKVDGWMVELLKRMIRSVFRKQRTLSIFVRAHVSCLVVNAHMCPRGGGLSQHRKM